MNLSPIARRALSHIEWGRAESYTTTKGRTKVVRTGIPTKPFWRWYPQARAELHKFGVTVRPNGSQVEYRKGKAFKRKLWEATCWNIKTLEGMGIH